MTSHQLAIAKASFSAGLLRPDPTSIARDDIAQFHSLLNAVISECSPTNVQKCKRWIINNVVQSQARVTALCKYLIALSASFTTVATHNSTTSLREPSSKRKRLHLLYLINDLLHYTKVHRGEASFSGVVQPSLFELFDKAASFKESPKHLRKLQELLDIWEDRDYYSKDFIGRLREAVRISSEGGNPTDTWKVSTENGDATTGPKAPRSAPYIMPAMHGDLNTPWYDLPAGNLMPHITPNSTRPINPTMVKPLHFSAGSVDEVLASAVKGLLQDSDIIFGAHQDYDIIEDASRDIDELGQAILRDEITNEILGGDGYYGWSKLFCEKMKRRRKGLGLDSSGTQHGRESRRRSRSRSQSSSQSDRSYKRRRYSSSNDDLDRSRGRDSREQSRSPSMGRRSSNRRRRESLSSRSASTSRSGPRYRSPDRNNLANRGASRSSFHDKSASLDTPQGQTSTSVRSPNLDPRYQQTLYPPPPPAPPSFSLPPDLHFGPSGMPIPPPPPPQYQGQWPPPPPPLMPLGQANQPSALWPPPPPPQLPQGQYNQGPNSWQQAPYGQQSGGGRQYASHQTGGARGGYESRGRGGASGTQHQNRGRGAGHNGGPGNRGNHRGGGGWS